MRQTLAKLIDPPLSVANADFPYMAVAELEVCGGIPARSSASSSGQLADEIGVPARYGEALAGASTLAGENFFGIMLYGTEALSVMRIEKGRR